MGFNCKHNVKSAISPYKHRNTSQTKGKILINILEDTNCPGVVGGVVDELVRCTIYIHKCFPLVNLFLRT